MTRARRKVPLVHTCPECGATKEWWASRLPFGRCAVCRKADKVTYQRERYAGNGGYYQRRHLLKKYGLTPASFKALRDAQGGCCAVCTRAFTDTPRVDHDHATGKVRGLLCGLCNRMLGLAGDDTDVLARAIAYLDRYNGRSVPVYFGPSPWASHE